PTLFRSSSVRFGPVRIPVEVARARPRDGRVVIGGGIALGPRHGRRIIVGTGSLVGGGRALVLGVGGRFFLRCRVALQVRRSGRSVLVDVMHACSPFSGAGPPSRKSVFVLERVVGVTLQQVADGCGRHLVDRLPGCARDAKGVVRFGPVRATGFRSRLLSPTRWELRRHSVRGAATAPAPKGAQAAGSPCTGPSVFGLQPSAGAMWVAKDSRMCRFSSTPACE